MKIISIFLVLFCGAVFLSRADGWEMQSAVSTLTHTIQLQGVYTPGSWYSWQQCPGSTFATNIFVVSHPLSVGISQICLICSDDSSTRVCSMWSDSSGSVQSATFLPDLVVSYEANDEYPSTRPSSAIYLNGFYPVRDDEEGLVSLLMSTIDFSAGPRNVSSWTNHERVWDGNSWIDPDPLFSDFITLIRCPPRFAISGMRMQTQVLQAEMIMFKCREVVDPCLSCSNGGTCNSGSEECTCVGGYSPSSRCDTQYAPFVDQVEVAGRFTPNHEPECSYDSFFPGDVPYPADALVTWSVENSSKGINTFDGQPPGREHLHTGDIVTCTAKPIGDNVVGIAQTSPPKIVGGITSFQGDFPPGTIGTFSADDQFKYFVFKDMDLTFENAKEGCEEFGAKLACIGTVEELDSILHLGQFSDLLVNLEFQDQDQEWRWRGVCASWFPMDWDFSAPPATQQCAALDTSSGTVTLHRTNCKTPLPALCKMPFLSSPKPIFANILEPHPMLHYQSSAYCNHHYQADLRRIVTRGENEEFTSYSSHFADYCPDGFWIGLKTESIRLWKWSGEVPIQPDAPTWWDNWHSHSQWNPYSGAFVDTETGQWIASDIQNDDTTKRCFACTSLIMEISASRTGLQFYPTHMNGALLSPLQAEIWDPAQNQLVETLDDFDFTDTTSDFQLSQILDGGKRYVLKYSIWNQAGEISIKTSCDCNLDYTNNGAPFHFSVRQVWDGSNDLLHKFNWTNQGRCGNRFKITKNSIASFETIEGGDSCNEVFLPTLSEQLTPRGEYPAVGSIGKYCIESYHDMTGYYSPAKCVDKAVEWATKLKGTVINAGGNKPVPNVNVSYQSEKDPAITGTVLTDSLGKFQFDIMTDLLVNESQPFRLYASLVSFNFSHIIDFDNSCPPDVCFYPFYSRGYGLINLDHGNVINDLILRDNSSYTVSGYVHFKNSHLFTDSGAPCPVTGAEVCATLMETGDVECIITEEDGYYIFSATFNLHLQITASYNVSNVTHQLEAPYSAFSMVQSYSNENIIADVLHTLEVVLEGGDCHRPIAAPDYTITASCGQTIYRRNLTSSITTADPISIDLPPLDYSVALVDVFPHASYATNLWDYFRSVFSTMAGATIEQSTSLKNQTVVFLIWTYHSAPEAQIEIIPTSESGCPRAVLGHPNPEPLSIYVTAWESYDDTTCSITGTFQFWDQLTNPSSLGPTSEYLDCLWDSQQGCTMELFPNDQLSLSQAVIVTEPGFPEPFPDHTKKLRVKLDRPFHFPNTVDLGVYIEGKYPYPESYSHEYSLNAVPSLILYDPPGDMSYSYLSQGTKVGTRISVNAKDATGGGASLEVMGGVSTGITTCKGPPGILICTTDGTASAHGGIFMTGQRVNGDVTTSDLEITFELTTEVTTSSSPNYPPPMSDVVITPAASIRYIRTDVVSVDADCNPSLDVEQTWQPQITTYLTNTIYDILQEISSIEKSITSLEEDLALLENDPQSEEYQLLNETLHNLEYGLDNWNRIIRYHDLSSGDHISTFSAAQSIDPEDRISCDSRLCEESQIGHDQLSFTGGGQTYHVTTETVNSFEEGDGTMYDWNFQEGLAGDASFSVFGIEWSMEAKGWLAMEGSFENVSTDISVGTTKVGFVLGDEDLGDKFNVRVWNNEHFGTPMFQMLNGVSKCPHEAKTLQREKVSLDIDPKRLDNVPPDNTAQFELTIINESENNDTTGYLLMFERPTNPLGLQFKLAGLPFTEHEMTLPLGKTTMILEAQKSLAYTYENIVISAYSPCEYGFAGGSGFYRDPISSSVPLSVTFLQPCPQVIWTGEWATERTLYKNINMEFDNNLEFIIKNPQFPSIPWGDHPNLQSIQVQYSEGDDFTYLPAFAPGGQQIELNDADRNASGYVAVSVDTSGWQNEGLYHIRIYSSCDKPQGALDPSLEWFETPSRTVRVDRTPPEVFGGFQRPGVEYWPADEISITFQEELDCGSILSPGSSRFRAFISVEGVYTLFNTSLMTPNDALQMGYLQMMCVDNTLYFQFGHMVYFHAIMGKMAIISVKNVQDLAQNYNPNLHSWGFHVSDVPDISKFYLKVQGIEIFSGYVINQQKNKQSMDEFGTVFCGDVEELVQAPGRCEFISFTGQQASFQFTPGDPSASHLYEAFHMAISEEDPDNLPPSLQNCSTNQMTYTITTTEAVPQLSKKDDKASGLDKIMDFWDYVKEDPIYFTVAILISFISGGILVTTTEHCIVHRKKIKNTSIELARKVSSTTFGPPEQKEFEMEGASF